MVNIHSIYFTQQVMKLCSLQYLFYLTSYMHHIYNNALSLILFKVFAMNKIQ